MEERGGEIAVGHGESPVEPPKRRTERIRNSWKAGTRGAVGLEHGDRLAILSGKRGRVEIGLDQAGGSVVRQVVDEDVLRILHGTEASI